MPKKDQATHHGKISKNLWISGTLSRRFDKIVEDFAKTINEKVETGEVGTAALEMFLAADFGEQMEEMAKLCHERAEKFRSAAKAAKDESVAAASGKRGPTSTPRRKRGA